MLGRQLYRIQHSKNFIEIPAGGHWVGNDEFNQLVRSY